MDRAETVVDVFSAALKRYPRKESATDATTQADADDDETLSPGTAFALASL